MKAKHTPGPWERTPSASGPMCFVSNAAGQTVAFAYAEGANCDMQTQKANAQLIAAAPDMLDALLAIENAPDGFKRAAVWYKVTRAIEKATGGKS